MYKLLVELTILYHYSIIWSTAILCHVPSVYEMEYFILYVSCWVQWAIWCDVSVVCGISSFISCYNCFSDQPFCVMRISCLWNETFLFKGNRLIPIRVPCKVTFTLNRCEPTLNALSKVYYKPPISNIMKIPWKVSVLKYADWRVHPSRVVATGQRTYSQQVNCLMGVGVFRTVISVSESVKILLSAFVTTKVYESYWSRK
jgi:hypothetical protein